MDGNLIQHKTNGLVAKPVKNVGSSLEAVLEKKDMHVSDSTDQVPIHQEESSVRNPADTDGLVNQHLCSKVVTEQVTADDGFSFSIEQLTCPVVIDFFCGSARLTASIKEVGLRDSFGVDHKLDKAIAAAKRLDLTVEKDQNILIQWLESPLVVGIFIAPPCGTCSLARNIKLRDATGKVMRGPQPLRSAEWPEGLPGLGPRDRARVSAANQLYAFVAQLVDLAHHRGLLVVVENPRSSIFWLTRFWKQIRTPMQYSAHQACAYGGERPKWTVLAWNHHAFASISKCCPGESDVHKHKPWGLVQSGSGFHFSTSEETAYPRGLAQAIARVFASILIQHGWNAPLEQMQEQQEVSLKSMRAIATAQPKASKMPPIVREHKRVVLLTGPHADLAKAPVACMQRLKQSWTIPASCTSEVTFLPEGAQLLRTTPLRSSGVFCNSSSWGLIFLNRRGGFLSVHRSLSMKHP